MTNSNMEKSLTVIETALALDIIANVKILLSKVSTYLTDKADTL